MRLSNIPSVIAASSLAFSAVNGLNVLISNDDGFGTANIRELYKAMKAFGHNVYIVASVTNQSGMGGSEVYTKYKNLTADSEFGIVKAGAPSIGTDPIDSHIWYYNGTPTTQIQVALDYILPRYTNLTTFDLVLSGVNYGTNMGPFLYTLAGTLGATYTAVERGIPAIAFSGVYGVQTPYYWVNTTTKAGLKDPATIMGQMSANLAQQIIINAKGGPILPLGYGVNVNIPLITSFVDDSCVDPPFIHTRMTGGATVDKAGYNETTGLFSWVDAILPASNQCINGDCSLPGETDVVEGGCQASVTVFTVDYDAPSGSCGVSPDVKTGFTPLVQFANSTNLVGGLNGTSPYANATTVTTSVSTSATAPASASSTGPVISNDAEPSSPGRLMAMAGLVMFVAML
ncbi:5'/3'-nucleotidase SurE [Phlyctema vagabunda]|uniref:5'/3'-nucleotidase SurE n=1 Tax=Phlyctema vagabunda TaxID=108571 RepID=A0ABR4PAA0_9HELO